MCNLYVLYAQMLCIGHFLHDTNTILCVVLGCRQTKFPENLTYTSLYNFCVKIFA